MEEDIKILEEFIEDYYLNREIVCVKDIQAIKNLINKIKEFQEIFKQINAIHKDKIFVEEMPFDLIIADTKYFMSGCFYDNFIQKSKVREKIEQLEKEQEQNRKELARGIDYLSNEMIEAASKKIGINLSIREYLQELLEERN